MSSVIKNGTVYIAPNATVVGDVVLEDRVNVWYGTVIRGDAGKIHIGARTNVQDNCILHSETTIGEGCTIGHGAIVHGCTVGDGSLIGMGAVVLTGAVLGDHCLVGAGAVVTGKTVAPAGSMLLGSPAKVVKTLTPEAMAQQEKDALHYVEEAKKALPLR